jgi:hypothetical protein
LPIPEGIDFSAIFFLFSLYDEEPEIFHLLEEYDYVHPKDVKHESPKVNVVILDDLLGSDAFTKKTKSVLVNTMIKNRHMGICFTVLVQSIKAVPKNIRLNYDFATDKPYGSLIIDTTNGKRFLSNLDSELFLQNKNVV